MAVTLLQLQEEAYPGIGIKKFPRYCEVPLLIHQFYLYQRVIVGRHIGRNTTHFQSTAKTKIR